MNIVFEGQKEMAPSIDDGQNLKQSDAQRKTLASLAGSEDSEWTMCNRPSLNELSVNDVNKLERSTPLGHTLLARKCGQYSGELWALAALCSSNIYRAISD